MFDALTSTRWRIQGTFFGWWIVASGCVLQAMHGGLLGQGFTVYFLPLQEDFGWSRALLSTGYSLCHIESGILGPVEGWFADRYGPRPVVLIGLLLFGTGFILLSMVHSIVPFFAVFMLIWAGSSLVGFVPVTVAILNWFVRKRGLALGITMAGSGFGGVIVPLVAWSITTLGWRPTALVTGLAIWLAGFPLALVLRHKPEQYGYLPDGELPAPANQWTTEEEAASTPMQTETFSDKSFSTAEALGTRAFWLIAAGHSSAVLMVAAVSLHLAPHTVQQLGISLETAGGIVALLMFITLAGRVCGGFIGDRINRRVLLVGCMIFHAVGVLLLAYAASMFHVFLFAVFHGLGWGGRVPTMQALRADYFGRTSIGAILGIASVPATMASVTAPIFAGWLADVQGDYRMAFTILAALAAVGAVCFAFASRPVQRG